MLSFLRLLKQRYASVLAALGDEEETRRRELRNGFQSLAFAEAFLEKGELNRAHPKHPWQLAVLGPTQVGKSSVVNWLLGERRAEVSPLAGFTVQPQGFAVGVQAADLAGIEDYFHDYQRCSRAELPAGRYDCYALEDLPPGARGPLRGAVVWDTPDFDSVDAEDYRQAVLRVAALADAVVLVLSKDKYADLSVWEFMALLEPLGQPVLVCLNKADPASSPALAASLRNKWRAVRQDPPPPIVALPYLEEGSLAGLDSQRAELLAGLEHARHADPRRHHRDQARRLLAVHWQAWLAPVQAEHAQIAAWRDLVEDAVRDSLKLYQRDCLDRPQHYYEAFQRALAELLTLLEIPGLGGALVAARRAVTWPVRQLAKLGRRRPEPPGSAEAAVLGQALRHLYIRVGEALLLRRDENPVEQAWWREVAALFRDDQAILSQRFDKAVADYLRAFQPEIDLTAQRLYEHLRAHPALLNGLRATRVTTDAAALAIALQTGGIGVQDFIIAPAMLSLTSLLTESALGRYMDKAADELKRKQLAAIDKLFRDTVQAPLAHLPGRLDPARRFDLPPGVLEAAAHLEVPR